MGVVAMEGWRMEIGFNLSLVGCVWVCVGVGGERGCKRLHRIIA
jgi:hypothetical protein